MLDLVYINKNPFFENKNASLAIVIDRMLKEKISHIVIEYKGKILGIMSEKDILSKIGEKRTWKIDLSRFKVSSFYNSAFYRVDISSTLSDVIEAMITNSYGIVPVFDDNNFLGIITKHDLMKLALKYKNVSLNEIVTFKPILATPEDKILNIRNIIIRENISIIPIIYQTKVLGVVRDIDILQYYKYIYERFSWNYRFDKIDVSIVRDVMRRDYERLDIRESIAQAANIFINKGSKGILIFSNKKFVGVLTKTDILNYLLYMS